MSFHSHPVPVGAITRCRANKVWIFCRDTKNITKFEIVIRWHFNIDASKCQYLIYSDCIPRSKLQHPAPWIYIIKRFQRMLWASYETKSSNNSTPLNQRQMRMKTTTRALAGKNNKRQMRRYLKMVSLGNACDYVTNENLFRKWTFFAEKLLLFYFQFRAWITAAPFYSICWKCIFNTLNFIPILLLQCRFFFALRMPENCVFFYLAVISWGSAKQNRTRENC